MSLTRGRPPSPTAAARGVRPFQLVEGEAPNVPACPATLNGQKPLASTRRAWDMMTTSPHFPQMVARGLDEVILVRWASLVDMRERAVRQYAESPTVLDSFGNRSLSPFWKVVTDCDKQLTSIEDRYGGSPLSRYRLGIAVAESETGMQKLARLMSGDAPDPRMHPGVGEGGLGRDPRVVDV